MHAAGIGLFLFIPLVLVLFLRTPLGVGPSLALGVGIMLAHRFVARPFMERHLARRCFWCGRTPADVPSPFRSRGRTIDARACGPDHAARLAAFARAVAAGRLALMALIFVPLVAYLANGAALAAGLDAVPLAAAGWGFKIPIASAVVALSLAYPAAARAAREGAVDFPVHNLFLLGVGNTLWVFRVVGIYWLVQGALALAAR